MSRRMLVIALVALTASACSSSRQAVMSDSRLMVQDSRDSVKVERVVVEVHDTLTITKTITIRENEQGDTIRMNTVTDRERIRSKADVRSMKEETRVIRDTVYVEKRDSSFVKNTNFTNDTNRASPVVQTLEWVFWIIIALMALMIVIKVSRI